MAISAGSVTFGDPTVGFLYTVGRYYDIWRLGNREYRTVPISSPGVSGTKQNHLGFRARAITLSVFYVAASQAACIALLEADSVAWADNNITVVGQENCYQSTHTITKDPHDSGHGTYWMRVALVFIQRAENA